jgi:hypothetical protein
MRETDGTSAPGFARVVTAMATTFGSKDYVAAHAFLPPNPRAVPASEVEARGRRLFDPRAARDEKRAILVLLAHHGSDLAVQLCAEYAANPDPDLAEFARLALEEAGLWAGYPAPVSPKGTCPCGSHRKFKQCCGAG